MKLSDRAPEEVVGPNGKMHTEHWALLVSVVALVVSGMTWWDSHGIARIQIAQATPHIDVKRSELRRFDPKKPNDFTLWMYAVNDGHLSVALSSVSVEPNIAQLPGDEARKPCYDDLSKAVFKQHSGVEQKIEVGKIAPIPVNVYLPASCSDTGWRFFADVTFNGRDQVNASYESLVEIVADVPSIKP